MSYQTRLNSEQYFFHFSSFLLILYELLFCKILTGTKNQVSKHPAVCTKTENIVLILFPQLSVTTNLRNLFPPQKKLQSLTMNRRCVNFRDD